MKQLDQGILVQRIHYGESSLVVHILTRKQGMRSFLFQGAKKKKGQVLLPFIPMEITYYQRTDSQLGKLTDMVPLYTLPTVTQHPLKSTILYFQGELIQRCLPEGVPDMLLFDFLVSEIQWLEISHELTNYPLYWLLQLSKYLGFHPHCTCENPSYFDLEEGLLLAHEPNNHTFEMGSKIKLLNQLLPLEKNEFLATHIPKRERKEMLDLLLSYFSFHIPRFGPLKSLEIIETLFE